MESADKWLGRPAEDILNRWTWRRQIEEIVSISRDGLTRSEILQVMRSKFSGISEEELSDELSFFKRSRIFDYKKGKRWTLSDKFKNEITPYRKAWIEFARTQEKSFYELEQFMQDPRFVKYIRSTFIRPLPKGGCFLTEGYGKTYLVNTVDRVSFEIGEIRAIPTQEFLDNPETFSSLAGQFL